MADPWTELRRHWAECEAKEVDHRRPEERPHLSVLKVAYSKLLKQGWQDIIYCPKDGTVFLAIIPGCAHVYECSYQGEWPNGAWWLHHSGDMWPAYPMLWKPMPASI